MFTSQRMEKTQNEPTTTTKKERLKWYLDGIDSFSVDLKYFVLGCRLLHMLNKFNFRSERGSNTNE